jgi:hypothetical protein
VLSSTALGILDSATNYAFGQRPAHVGALSRQARARTNVPTQ